MCVEHLSHTRYVEIIEVGNPAKNSNLGHIPEEGYMNAGCFQLMQHQRIRLSAYGKIKQKQAQ